MTLKTPEPETTPVVGITGADGQVGRALIDKVKGTAITSIAMSRHRVDLPVTRLIRGPCGSRESQEAMRAADIIVHLAGTLRPTKRNSYEAANVETTRAVAQAVRAGRARRILYLSYVGASEESANAYLRTKACAERLLAETGRDVVVFRCTHIIGPPEAPGPMAEALHANRAGWVTVLGNGRQLIAPVYRGDVVSALLAAIQCGAPGRYDLAGPDRVTLDELVRLLNSRRAVRIVHVPEWAARVLGLVIPGLTGPLVDVLLNDSVGESSRAAHTFGLQAMSLREVWRQAANGESDT